MDARKIRELLKELGARLADEGLLGEMLVVRGTAMALAFDDLRRTKDIDAVFEPKQRIYAIASQMAKEKGLVESWLNDAAKGFLSAAAAGDGEHTVLDLPGLVVRVPSARYLFAMKALAARPEDLEDLRFLVNHLKLTTLSQALDILDQYYPRERIPARSQFFLEEIFSGRRTPSTFGH